jgi:hypothetical protein
MEKAKGAAERGTGRSATRIHDGTPSPRLADLGVTKKQSSQWQKLADLGRRDGLRTRLAAILEAGALTLPGGAIPSPTSLPAPWRHSQAVEFHHQKSRDTGGAAVPRPRKYHTEEERREAARQSQRTYVEANRELVLAAGPLHGRTLRTRPACEFATKFPRTPVREIILPPDRAKECRNEDRRCSEAQGLRGGHHAA